jgi:hypothetical protein
VKRFKKKHAKIPRVEVIRRLIRRLGPELADKYDDDYEKSLKIFPDEVRAVCLPQFDPGKRQNIRYYPDLHNWAMYDLPNRSLPIPKFLDLFRNYVKQEILDQISHDLTNYRLEFYTTADDWEATYAHEEVDSCMTGTSMVRCYAHPQNKLALAALFAPGGNELIARTIVNTDEKWYVRLFGDPLLVEKLRELGYNKLSGPPRAFRMYGWVGNHYTKNEYSVPYFDFPNQGVEVLHDTHNPDTGYIELIINPGNV